MIRSARRVQLAKTDAVTVTAIETGVPALTVARDLTERFHDLLLVRDVGALTGWLAETSFGLMASFGKGIIAELAAVMAALTETSSNGQTEGQITRLKPVKRQMEGRASLDLLRARRVASS